VFPPSSQITQKPLVTPTPIPLNTFLQHQGFGVVKLRQENLERDPKRLVIDVEINRVRGSLEVDTGAGGTVVARNSLKKFHLAEQKTPIQISTFGKKSASNTFWSITELNTLAMGNSVIRSVPVAIKEIPHLDGLLGSPEMHRVGAVLDCAEPALYLARKGPNIHTSDKLAAMLQSKGFTQVPLRLNSDHHLEVDCSIDGVPSTMLVDTGSRFTFVDESIGIKAGIMMTRPIAQLKGSDSPPLSIGRIKKLAVRDFEINDADICFVDLKRADHPSTYLLGMSELVTNSAIIDVGGLRMYLRHPQ
jgi:predicted aspartyl protease